MTWRRSQRFVSWLLVCAGLTGCEALLRKFERKSKAGPRPSPIFSFEDYSKSTTPVDRYRKHYALFNYWSSELIDALSSSSPNPKRLTKSSAESLYELQQLQHLLQDGAVPALAQLVEDRTRLDAELQGGKYPPSRLVVMRRDLEAQAREAHRQLNWRNVEDKIQADPVAPAVAPEPAATVEPTAEEAQPSVSGDAG